MRTNGLKLTFIFCLVTAATAFAQCVAPDFTLPATACKGQRIALTPDDTYSSYEWDLCSGELAGTPTASVLTNSFGGYGFKLELVEDNGDYYGFFLTRASNKLYRLDFGTDINNPPLLVELGGLGKNSNTWRTIEIVKEGSDYIGFIIDESAIYRLNFGNSVANTPQPIETFYSGSPMSLSIDAAAVQEGSDKYLFVVNSGNDQVIRFKFAGSFADPSGSTTIDTFTIPFAVASHGISAIKDCDKWYLVTSSIIVASVYKIALDDLSDPTPTITQYSVPSAGGVAVVKDNNTYMIFAQSLNSTSSIFRLTFGSDLSGNPVSTDELKDFGYTPGGPSVFGFAMYKVKSDWLVASAENAGANMYRITFPQSCLASSTWSAESNPVVTTSNAGNFNITLDVTDGSGLHSSIAHPIAVSSSTSPDIEFTSTNVCAGHDVTFDSQNTSDGITSYDWDFGDMTSSTTDDPAHQFTAGTYNVALTVTASSSGCSNTAVHPLKIYSPPVADFQVPAGLVCTNNDFTFVNLIPDTYDGLLIYQWLVNGDEVGTTRDLVYAFTSTGGNDVKMVATIPGCFDDEEKSIGGILPGPSASFVVIGQCQSTDINFQNGSSGSITSYLWDFDNGNTSDDFNTTTTYATPGTYTPTLQAFAPNGCVTTVKKDLTIYSKPSPAFTLDLPPFSCSGTPSQFHDATPAPSDSNVQGWDWTFGDGGTGTGKNPAHTYPTAGQFNVGLTATTDKGCSNTGMQQVTITQSPAAAFDSGPACVGKSTELTDRSTGDVASWQWKIGSAIYTSQNAQHTFSTAGNYAIQLTVTGDNSCTNSITKQAVIPVVPAVDFHAINACAGQSTVLDDVTLSDNDPIKERHWTINNNTNLDGDEVSTVFGAAQDYPVQLQIQTQSGCVYSTTKEVTVHQSPAAIFAVSDTNGPPPLVVLFTNNSVGTVSSQWDFGDGTTSTEDSPAHTFAEKGEYSVSLTVANAQGCSATGSIPITIADLVSELALLEFSLTQNSDNVSWQPFIRVQNNGNYRVFAFNITYEVGGTARFQQSVIGTLEVGQEKLFMLSNLIAGQAENSYVCIELQNDQNMADNKLCTLISGSSHIFNVSPNPATDYLNIESVVADGDVQVKIYNMSGGLAYDRSFNAQSYTRLSLDVQNLSPGLYVVVVSTSTATSSQKILIAR